MDLRSAKSLSPTPGIEARPAAPGHVSVWPAIRWWLARAIDAVASRRRFHRDIACLRRLDDRTLEDIGYTRDELERLARGGR